MIRNSLFRFVSGAKFISRAQNAHGLHSPFAYQFYCQVLHAEGDFSRPVFYTIEQKRKAFLHSGVVLSGIDYGANGAGNQITEKLCGVAAHSLKKRRRARLIARIAAMNDAKIILEFGTSLGITTAYLAAFLKDATIVTMEGNQARLQIAEDLFSELGLKNIRTVEGMFDFTLPKILSEFQSLDVVFLDGNHRKEATLNYFTMVKSHLHQGSIVIVDDIRWSKGMYEAWIRMKEDEAVEMSVELLDIGILFFRKDLYKKHFLLRG